ncbi:carboxylesterase family protein [uncultured Marinobacter sp.]|uniref:carboxylesterase family protein n=1 Tax=uncultured Marinobacter sp. TaxID=187379 RepID=UPI0030D9EA0C
MNIRVPSLCRHRPAMLCVLVAPLLFSLAGCNSDSDDSSDPVARTGSFAESPVSGINYSGTATTTGVTDQSGRFSYRDNETITFAIGDLILGSADGSERVTTLAITEGAVSASDPAVSNRLILLQTLDEDGDLNNGIQISEAIRTLISDNADLIDFDQSTANFRASLEPLLTELNDSGAFTDTDPRPRTVKTTADVTGFFHRATSPRVTMTTSGGELRGFEANDSTWQFLGVPYGKPPLGDLRWRPPQPAESWSGIRDAVAWADQSAQDTNLESVNEGGMSEDSLYLNITSPKDASGLPVMVWFHGGSFSILSANSKQYNNPDSLTGKGVVLVTVNHRLGPFGYIGHPLLTEESDYNGSGNYGQMDLVLALKWVQDNIAAFGGDPDNVTIFGQSGGGGKTYALMNSPRATGLFHKAIIQSGSLPPGHPDRTGGVTGRR